MRIGGATSAATADLDVNGGFTLAGLFTLGTQHVDAANAISVTASLVRVKLKSGKQTNKVTVQGSPQSVRFGPLPSDSVCHSYSTW